MSNSECSIISLPLFVYEMENYYFSVGFHNKCNLRSPILIILLWCSNGYGSLVSIIYETPSDVTGPGGNTLNMHLSIKPDRALS